MMKYHYDKKWKTSVHFCVCEFLYLEDGLDCPKYVGTNHNIVLLYVLYCIAFFTYIITRGG
jgi:hypothetical protein